MLKTGYKVEFQNNKAGIVLKSNNIIILTKETFIKYEDNYDGFKNKFNSEYDIIGIYEPKNKSDIVSFVINDEDELILEL